MGIKISLDKVVQNLNIPPMRIVSWNVNGLRAILRKNFYAAVDEILPDILCLQEIKADRDSIPEIDLQGYEKIFNPAARRGYSGTAVFSKIKPQNIDCRTSLDGLVGTTEGRVILVEYANFFLVNVYTPNSGGELKRLAFRHSVWDPEMLRMLLNLGKTKAVILCGDMNVANGEIDLENPNDNHFSAGFTDEERQGMANILANFGVDTFRHFYPNKEKCYSWWSYRTRSRERNVGWRIDYVIVGKSLVPFLKSAFIGDEILGSDHAPVGIDIDL
ncbi:MAG: exodeoxyribonuclease III [Puniceicoccales bacterium]|jgi:exodeoxyribonuclease-3|nr:exodeoxyribonuclease III [Puniceicoccales bacterium]